MKFCMRDTDALKPRAVGQGVFILFCSNFMSSALGATYVVGLTTRVWTKEHVFVCLHKENMTVFRLKLHEAHMKKRADSWYKAIPRSFDLAD